MSGSPGAALKIAYALQNAGAVNLGRDVGASVPVKHYLGGLKRRGHTVRVCQLRGRQVVEITDLNRPGEVRRLQGGTSSSGSFLGFESVARRLQRILRLPYFAFFDSFRFFDVLRRVLPDYDLCHEHNGLFSAGAAWASARTGTPYVLTFDADLIFELDVVNRPLKGIHRRAAERIAVYTYRRADAILCVSNPARKRLVEHWHVRPDKVHVVPNGVDVDMFAPSGEPGGESGVVAFVGGFQPWHGLDLLIESFSRVLAEYPDAELLLIGDGPERESIEARAAELGISGRVTITGLVPQPQVPAMLARAAVAVLPYPRFRQELWFSPLKLFEYMAAGKAIVAARAGQIPAILEDGKTALLVEPGSVSELARAILALLASTDKRRVMGAAAREQAVERHSWDGYVDRLESIYSSVLEAKSST